MITIREANIKDVVSIALLGRVTFNESHSKYIENKEDVLAYTAKVFRINHIKQELQDKNILF